MKIFIVVILCVLFGLSGCCKKCDEASANKKLLSMSFDTEEQRVVYWWSFLPKFNSVESKKIRIGEEDYEGYIIKYSSKEEGSMALASGEPIAAIYERRIGTDLDIYILSPVSIHLEYPKEKLQIHDMYKEQLVEDAVMDLSLGIYRFKVTAIKD